MLTMRSLALSAALLAGCHYELSARDVCGDGACLQMDMGSSGDASTPQVDGFVPAPIPDVGTIEDPKKPTVDGKTGPRVYEAKVSPTQTRTFVCWPSHGGAETNCRWYEPSSPTQLPTLVRTTNMTLVGYDFNFQNAADGVILTTGYNSLPWYDIGQAPAAAVSVQIGGTPAGVSYYILRPPATLAGGMTFDLRAPCPLNKKASDGTEQPASCRFR